MSDGSFNGFSAQALAFLEDLEAHNDRVWFAEHKDIHEAEVKQPASVFAELIATHLETRTGIPHNAKVFRIHRDVRFSKDKRPYNAHLHIAFKPHSPLEMPPMWFFGLDPRKVSLGCGVFAFGKQELVDFRDRVAGAEGADLVRSLDRLRAQGARLGEPALKRVPPGYDKQHARADLLRHKGLAVWFDFEDRAWVTATDVVPRTLAEFDRLRPVFDWLNRT